MRKRARHASEWLHTVDETPRLCKTTAFRHARDTPPPPNKHPKPTDKHVKQKYSHIDCACVLVSRPLCTPGALLLGGGLVMPVHVVALDCVAVS